MTSRRDADAMPLAPPPPPVSTRLETDRLVLRPPHATDVPEIRRLLRSNVEHLRPWSPVPRPGEDPSSLTEISKAVLKQRREWTRGEAYVFFLTPRAALVRPAQGDPSRILEAAPRGALVGRIALTGVMRGAFWSAHIGYWVDAGCQRIGLTTEAVGGVLSFAFCEVGLHRVQAAVMPRNAASKRVLQKLGFRKEGESLRYLQIAGAWEDHEIFALTAEEWPGATEHRS